MLESIVSEGRTTQEAIDKGLAKLNVSREKEVKIPKYEGNFTFKKAVTDNK